MARISDLHRRWVKEPKYRKAYDALIAARNGAGLAQEELTRRMETNKPMVARIGSGCARPSMRTASPHRSK